MKRVKKGRRAIVTLSLFVVTVVAHCQTTFTRVTDSGNPIVTDPPPPGYPGCSWIDYDNDGRLDLSITGTTPNRLYRNLGNGNFQSVVTGIGLTQPIVPGSGGGHSWADYNNDGLIDVCVTGAKTFLYRNNGDGTFSKILTGVLADSMGNRGWSCTWGDYDQDGNVDLIIVHPVNFFPPGSTPNVFLRNDGPPNYTFTRIDTTPITSQGFRPYTVGSFVDYDLDGDLDFFIGSGPVSTPGVDYLYRNMKSETGIAYFTRITDFAFATDLADGQNWNWIDIDNDGDLDGYRTNYSAVRRNDLYRDDNGTYVKVTNGSIVTDQFISLANVWGDFDNDGDLDCIVVNDNGQHNNYYDNNGDGTFTSITTGDLVTNLANHHAATVGDFDNDGDLDVFVDAVQPAGKALYRNDLSNGNTWVNILCTGTASNRSGIGTKIRAKATINGRPQWQIREVSSQNGFNGANMLNVHFGFGNAAIIDSLEILWPLGLRQVFVDVQPDRFYHAVEGQPLELVSAVGPKAAGMPQQFRLGQNYPNPFNPTTHIDYELPGEDVVSLKVFDVLGREVATLVDGRIAGGRHTVAFNAGNLPSGVYLYRMETRDRSATQKLLLLK